MTTEPSPRGASSSPESDSVPPTNLANSTDSLQVIQNGLEKRDSEAKDGPSPKEPNSFPPPKTDKPRPHVCKTCTRSFARLEHLKRHERSHTKEKPFECPECTRCFARRDLLLRHQQKLHLTTTPSSRSRAGRRESTSAIGPNPSGKIRKNSTTGSAQSNGSNSTLGGTQRPRANTISHIDAPTLGLLAAANRGQMANNSNMHQSSLGLQKGLLFNKDVNNNGMNMFRGTDNAANHHQHHHHHHHGNTHHLPRLNTQGLHVDDGSALRTAPPGGPFGGGFGYEQMFGQGSTTINPAQLQLDEGARSASAAGFQHRHYSQVAAPFTLMEEDDNFEWLRGFNTQMSFNGTNDHAIAASSPSAMSNGSQNGMNDPLPTGHDQSNGTGSTAWQQNFLNAQTNGQSQMPMDNGVTMFPNVFGLPDGTFSPTNVNGANGMEHFYPSPSPISGLNNAAGMTNLSPSFQPPMAFSSDGTSISSSSINGSARQSSVASASAESLTEMTRQALILSLSQPSVFGHGRRHLSQPNVSSPLSPRDSSKVLNTSSTLPNLQDLQRYVAAYIQFFHPHFPFLHIPTLSFDSPTYTTNIRGYGNAGIVGGGGCLILSMAAIGALYEFDRAASKDLFDAAKKMIQLYLEERRKADLNVSAPPANQKSGSDQPAHNTPLWLVQAMLLNVVYGHNCGDKIAGDIASTHCSALVSLARAANLLRPADNNADHGDAFHVKYENPGAMNGLSEDVQLQNAWGNNGTQQKDDQRSKWYRWAANEERKRTLFAIFHMSSLLVSAYNHAPALMNSEIHLALPCEEDLWAAESASLWATKGGMEVDNPRSVQFADALTTLLMASQQQNDASNMSYNQPFGSGIPMTDLPHSDLRPSTFGCLVLINALHNYIWETRQRHCGRQWTNQETEAMHAHIEPALRAWQAAWASNPMHSLERPNPYGMGPLSADSIPLLDLAYVRLFVNLGSSKTLIWQRDFETMAEELAHGTEIIENAENAVPNRGGFDMNNSHNGPFSSPPSAVARNSAGEQSDVMNLDLEHGPLPQSVEEQAQSTRRERQLRKAAFYAADSMSMSDKLGVTFVDFTSRELPVQSAICTFDCAQVLAEWVATVQERVGRYLGILGKDHIDYAQVPAIMLLEDEDCRLLERINDILKKAEAKMTFELNRMTSAGFMSASKNLPSVNNKGFGSNILMVTAYMLDRAAVWPVLSSIAQGLEIQAEHMSKRAIASVSSVPNASHVPIS